MSQKPQSIFPPSSLPSLSISYDPYASLQFIIVLYLLFNLLLSLLITLPPNPPSSQHPLPDFQIPLFVPSVALSGTIMLFDGSDPS